MSVLMNSVLGKKKESDPYANIEIQIAATFLIWNTSVIYFDACLIEKIKTALYPQKSNPNK